MLEQAPWNLQIQQEITSSYKIVRVGMSANVARKKQVKSGAKMDIRIILRFEGRGLRNGHFRWQLKFSITI